MDVAKPATDQPWNGLATARAPNPRHRELRCCLAPLPGAFLELLGFHWLFWLSLLPWFTWLT